MTGLVLVLYLQPAPVPRPELFTPVRSVFVQASHYAKMHLKKRTRIRHIIPPPTDSDCVVLG